MFSKGLLLSPPVPVCPYLTDAAPHTNQPILSFGVDIFGNDLQHVSLDTHNRYHNFSFTIIKIWPLKLVNTDVSNVG